MGIDPSTAHTLDARTLLALLPGINVSDLREIREQFASYLTTRPGRAHDTWQAAWNAYTGARPGRDGVLTYTPARCTNCKGRGFTTRNPSRNLARTGSPTTCAECRGLRRGSPTRQQARAALIPAAAAPTAGDENGRDD